MAVSHQLRDRAHHREGGEPEILGVGGVLQVAVRKRRAGPGKEGAEGELVRGGERDTGRGETGGALDGKEALLH